ncbi:MFS general substrate transporter [Calocera viscosa TUFC12733]|uniref:MFS general substrate transporter n=1 Tax=Calocera viscosa (strain TUFC12733) TaxID=1330018 RepID=A0A167RED0_CALVF|nr:MFS general substrate transporter [Calocera viscosa TUFC12733]
MAEAAAAEAIPYEQNEEDTVTDAPGAEPVGPASVNKEARTEDGKTHEAVHPHTHIPDGGLEAWLTVVGAWFISAICYGYVNAYGVYQAYYVQTLLPSYSPSAISWIGSLQAYLLFAVGIFTGPLFDRGYFRHLMIGGSILYVGCLFAQAEAKEDQYYQIFLSQGLGQGLAQGIIYLPSFAVMSHHFRKRRAFAMGLAVSGSSTGGILFPIMINNLIVKNGFPWAVRACGFFVLGATVMANLLIRTRYVPHHKSASSPSPLKLLRDIPYVVCIACTFFISLGQFFVFFYIQLFSISRGLNETFSFYTISFINGASVVGRTIPNLIADKIGIFPVFVPTSVVAGAVVFAMFGISTIPAVIIFCLLYGFFSGAYISLMGPMFAAMADHPSEMGARMGLAFALVGVAALVGTPIDGALVGNGPDYVWWKAIVFSSIVMLAGCGFGLVGGILLAKKRGKRWV